MWGGGGDLVGALEDDAEKVRVRSMGGVGGVLGLAWATGHIFHS